MRFLSETAVREKFIIMNSDKLIAHWPLRGDARDVVGGFHGKSRRVRWVAGADGGEKGAALFNGRESVIEVANDPALQLGTAPFTFTAMIKCHAPMRGVFGDVLSKFDTRTRCGLNINVSGGSAGYSGQSYARHLHAGIDDAYMGPWLDHGRPEVEGSRNPLVSTLTPYNGKLYAGVTDARDADSACRVFSWAGGDKWVNCGRVSPDPACPSVMSMVAHDGGLYVGTGSWDWGRAQQYSWKKPPITISGVYRYEGGTKWRDLEFPAQAQRLLTMTSFEGRLYAATDRGAEGHCFAYDGERWHDCGKLDERDNFECLFAHGGSLYGASHIAIYRYEGKKHWRCLTRRPYDIIQIHALQGYGGALWAGTWPQGYILRHEGGEAWTNTGLVGISTYQPGVAQINEINSLGVHNGKLYAGVLPKAQIYRYEQDGQWTLLGNFASSRGYTEKVCPTWMRILSLTTFQGALFACNGTSQARTEDSDPDLNAGRVMSCQAGLTASYDYDLGDGWNHIAVARRGSALSLYVNGKLAQRSTIPKNVYLHLGNGEPLLIGSGAQGGFDGAISDVRLYGAALSAAEIRSAAKL